MRRKSLGVACALLASLLLSSCSYVAVKEQKVVKEESEQKTEQKVEGTDNDNKSEDNKEFNEGYVGEIMISCAASLEVAMEEDLIPLFNEIYPNIKVEGTYDSSGKLQAQIEEGASVDVFFSAATKQMDALVEKDLIDKDSVKELLKNKIVLISSKADSEKYKSFEDMGKAEVIALGDPESVPVGQYAKEALTNMKLWDANKDKFTYGTNVTEVLNWVADGNAELGIVYATDAAKLADKVEVISYVPEDIIKDSIYPIGIVKSSREKDYANNFIKVLSSDDGKALFRKYGFIVE